MQKFGHRVFTKETICATICLYFQDSSTLYSNKKWNEFCVPKRKNFFHELICALPFDRVFAVKIEFFTPGKVHACPQKKKR
jgi:hypothetical protein